MFKSFSDSSRNQEFHGFPSLNFQMNVQRYNISACSMDLDARYGTNTTTNLAAISSWKDQITGYEFVQATAGNQPRYLSSDVNFNNYPAVDFSVDTARTLNSQFGAVIKNQFIIVAVFRVIAFPGTQRGIVCAQNGAGGNNLLRISTGRTDQPMGVQNSNTTYLLTGDNGDTSPHILIASNTNLVVDGVLKDSQPSYGWLGIMNSIGTQSAAYNGRNAVTRILVYDTGATTQQLLTLSDAINAEYAIY